MRWFSSSGCGSDVPDAQTAREVWVAAPRRSRAVLEESCGRVARRAARLEIADCLRDGAVLGQSHQRGQGDSLPATLGDEARAQAVAAKISGEPG